MAIAPAQGGAQTDPGSSGTATGVALGLAAAMSATYLAFAKRGVDQGLLPQCFGLLRFATAGVLILPFVVRHGPSDLAGVGWGRGIALALLAGPLFILLGVAGCAFALLSHGAATETGPSCSSPRA